MALFTRDSKVKSESINSNCKISFVTDETIDWKVLKISYDEFSFKYEFVDLIEYTYIMSDDLNSTFKIGRTTNKPTERLTNLRTANPNISMSMVFPFQEYSEKNLHEKYDTYRKDREWFFKTKELSAFVDSAIKKRDLIINGFKNHNELWKI